MLPQEDYDAIDYELARIERIAGTYALRQAIDGARKVLEKHKPPPSVEEALGAFLANRSPENQRRLAESVRTHAAGALAGYYKGDGLTIATGDRGATVSIIFNEPKPCPTNSPSSTA